MDNPSEPSGRQGLQNHCKTKKNQKNQRCRGQNVAKTLEKPKKNKKTKIFKTFHWGGGSSKIHQIFVINRLTSGIIFLKYFWGRGSHASHANEGWVAPYTFMHPAKEHSSADSNTPHRAVRARWRIKSYKTFKV